MTAFAACWREPLRGALGALDVGPAIWRNGAPEIELIRAGLLLAPLTITRSQASGARSTALDADGISWREFNADLARFNGVARRLRIEPQRTNFVTDPRFEGWTAGSPGTVPASWTATMAGTGLTREIIKGSLPDGSAFVGLRYFGTPSLTTGLTLTADAVAAVAGDRYLASALCWLQAGTLANIGTSGIRASPEANSNFTLTTTPTVRQNTRVLTGTVAQWGFRQTFLDTVTPVDFTLGLALPMHETGFSFTNAILPPVGTPGASTRGADLITASLASLGIGGNGACTIIGTAMLPQLAGPTAPQILLQIDNGTDANRMQVRIAVGGGVFLASRTLDSAGADAAGAGTMVAGIPFRWGATMDGSGRIAASMDSGAAQAVSGGPVSGLTTLRIGSNSFSSSNVSGEIGSLRVLPFGVSDIELQRLVAEQPT